MNLVLLTLGDSHSLYTFAGVAEAKIYWRGPVTMHRAARDGIASLLPNYLKLTHGDVIVLCFGEIDCRAHIRKQGTINGRSSAEEVDLLTERYARALETFRKKTKARIALSCIPPFVHGNLGYEFYETREECLADAKVIRERMNRNLASLGYPFIDFYQAVALPDGSFRPEFSDGVCHLDSRRSEPVIKALESLFPVKFSHREPPWPHPRSLVERPRISLSRCAGKTLERFLKSVFLRIPGVQTIRFWYKSKL